MRKSPRAFTITKVSMVTLASLTMVGPLAIDMYLAAIPHIANDLNTTAAMAQLTLTAFMIGMGLGQFLIGPLSDRIGRTRPLYISVVVSVLTALACVFAPSVELFIAARFVMGLAGATGVVLARAIIADSTSGLQTAKIMGILMMINGLGPVLAPLLGGFVLTVGTWRTVFAVLAGIMFVSMIAVYAVIRESLPVEKRRTGSVLSTYKGVVEVMTMPRYRGFMLTLAFGFGSLFSYVSGSTYVLQNVLGLTPLQFTWVFGLNSVGIVGSNMVATKLVGRVSMRKILMVGTSLMVLNAACLTVHFRIGISLVPTMIMLFIGTCSMGLIFGTASSLAIMEARHTAGSASAMMGTVQFLVAGVAAPLVGSGGATATLPMALCMLGFAVLAFLSLVTTPVKYGDWTPEGAEYHSNGGPKTGQLPTLGE